MADLKIRRLHPLAQLPTKATPGSAGYDLYSVSTEEIYPYEMTRIPTGIAIELPTGYYGQICCRSSLAIRKLTTLGGVIDNDYRGEIYVTLINHSNVNVKIFAGMRVGQIICIPYANCNVIEVARLSDTVRGEKGFGSSGK